MAIEVPSQRKAATELATLVGKAVHSDNVTTEEIIEVVDVFLRKVWLEGSQAGFERGAEIVTKALDDAMKGTL